MSDFLPARSRRYASLALLLSVGLSACGDGPTGARQANGTPARIAFTPRFTSGPASGAQAADFGVSFDRVRVVIVRPPSTSVLDTTVSFKPGDADLSLDLRVTTLVANEAFNVTLEYRDASRALFSGTASVIAQPLDAEPTGGTTIDVAYVGPGADAAHLSITPRPIAVFTGTTVHLAAQALNAGGTAESNVPINWSVDDATLATLSSTTGSTTDLQASSRRGNVTVIARTPTGIIDQATILVTPPAATLQSSSGDGQAGVVNAQLSAPVVVRAVDDAGLPVPNTTVTWSAVNGTTASTTSVTDISGLASTTLKLGTTSGTATATASITVGSSTKQVVFSATAAPGPLTSLSFLSQPTNATAGVTFAPSLQVRLLDAFGNTATAANSVTLSLTGGTSGAALGGTVTKAAVDGIATFNDLSIVRQGAGYRIAASVGAVQTTSNAFNIAAAAPAQMEKIAGDGRTAVAATAVDVAPAVRLSDAFGNPVGGVTVQFAPADEGSGSVAGGTVTTGADGVATVGSWTVGNTMGPNTLLASGASLTTSFSATVTGGVPPGIRLVVGALGSASQRTAVAGQDITVPITVDLTSRGGVDFGSVAVTLSWDPAALTFKSLSIAPPWFDSRGAAGNVTTNTSNASIGSIRVGAFTSSATFSSFAFVNVVFTVHRSATITAQIDAAGNAAADRITVIPRPQSITVTP